MMETRGLLERLDHRGLLVQRVPLDHLETE